MDLGEGDLVGSSFGLSWTLAISDFWRVSSCSCRLLALNESSFG